MGQGDWDLEVLRERDGHLATLMARLAAGDGSAIGDFLEAFSVEVERVVRGLARHRGARLDQEDVQGLVIDAVLEIGDLAVRWKPDGAPPWHWARHRIANCVDATIGQWADSIDSVAVAAPAAGTFDGHGPIGPEVDIEGYEAGEDDVVEALARLALIDPRVALLDEAVRMVASERDRRLFYETISESVSGSRAHADVVARLHGLPQATVRQQVHRVRSRVRHLAATDDRFAELAEMLAVA